MSDIGDQAQDSKQEPTKNLYQKLALIMGAMDKVEKTGKNAAQGYAFVEQAVVVAKLRPLLAEHGVIIIPGVVSNTLEATAYTDSYGKPKTNVRSDMVTEWTLINADKPDERIVTQWASEANDTSDKATNKALTAAQKTFYMKLFNVSDKDDPDADHVETPAPNGQPKHVGPSAASPGRAPAFPSKERLDHMQKLLTDKGYSAESKITLSRVACQKDRPTTAADVEAIIALLEESK